MAYDPFERVLQADGTPPMGPLSKAQKIGILDERQQQGPPAPAPMPQQQPQQPAQAERFQQLGQAPQSPFAPPQNFRQALGQGISNINLNELYALGRGNTGAAANFRQQHDAKQQAAFKQQQGQNLVAELGQVLPQGIKTEEDIQTAVKIGIRNGMEPGEAVEKMVQAQQQAQIAQIKTRDTDLKIAKLLQESGAPDTKVAEYVRKGYDKIGGQIYESVMDNFTRIHDSYTEYKRSIDAGEEPNPQAYQTLAIGIQKMLDPDSIVRGSEYDRSEYFQSLLDRAGVTLEMILKGTVPLEFLTMIYEESRRLAQSSAKTQGPRYQRFKKQSAQFGVTDLTMPIYSDPSGFDDRFPYSKTKPKAKRPKGPAGATAVGEYDAQGRMRVQ